MYRLFLLAGLGCVTIAPATYADETCKSSGPALTSDAITKSLHDRGFTQIRSLATHNGCYEAKGIDNKGKRFELEVNASTGEIVNQE